MKSSGKPSREAYPRETTRRGKHDGTLPSARCVFGRHPLRQAQEYGVAERCLPKAHKTSGVGSAVDGPVHL